MIRHIFKTINGFFKRVDIDEAFRPFAVVACADCHRQMVAYEGESMICRGRGVGVYYEGAAICTTCRNKRYMQKLEANGVAEV